MAKIRVNIEHMLVDGMPLTFRAPCVSASADGIKIYYPNESGVLQAKEFTFKDCHGNALASFDNLFVSGAYVKVILNTTAAEAYIQNADTNAYLEARFKALEENSGAPAEHTHAANDITGGTFAGRVDANSNHQTPGEYLLRNQKLSANGETPTVNGEIAWHYE